MAMAMRKFGPVAERPRRTEPSMRIRDEKSMIERTGLHKWLF